MSHALRVGVVDQIGYFRAYNTDGSAKTDLTSSTTGLTLSVFRVGATAVSISSLSAKAADNTAHSDGAIRAVSGNLYTVDLPDAACADQVPSISVKGSYTGGVIEGPEHPLVGYDPASVAVGALTPTTANRTIDVSAAGAVTVSSIEANVVTASALAADAVAEIQSGLATPTNITAATGITVSSIGANVVTASALAADAVAEIQSGLATPTNITAATGITVSSIGANVVTASALAADAVAEIQSGLATPTNITAATGITVSSIGADVVNASALAADAVTEIQSGLATAANLLIVSDGVGFITSVLLGTISDAGTAGETYVITFGGATYTLDYTGLDATGNRTGVTRTKV